MPHEGGYSFEVLSEPVYNRAWNRGDEDQRPRPTQPTVKPRPVSDVSPISANFENGLPEAPNPLASTRYERHGIDIVSPIYAPPHPFQEVRRTADEPAVRDVPLGRAPSFLEVRRAANHVPERVERPIPRSTVPTVRRKPVPENPRSRTVPYSEDDFRGLEAPSSTEPWARGNDIEIAPGYPPKSHSLGKTGRDLWSMILTNLLFLFIPLIFFALAIVLGVNDNKATNDRQHWAAYWNLMVVAGTFFPVAFAALIGRAAVKVAGYRLEHGVKLGSLEQIMGSMTFGNAIGTHARLRFFNLLGLGLLVLWVMSPIGSQAFLRLLSLKVATSKSQTTMPYFDTDSESLLAKGSRTSPPDAAQLQSTTTFTSMYIAAVLGPSDTKNGSMDLWGNVKIPYQSSLEETIDGWASPNDSTVYSALTGIPIAGIQMGVTDLSMESSYIELNCGSIIGMSTFVDLQPFEHDSLTNATYSLSNGTYHGSNVSSTTLASNLSTATWSLGMDTFISPEFNRSLSTTSSTRSCQPGDNGYIASPCYLRDLSDSQATMGTLLFQSLDVSSDSTPSPSIQAALCQVQQTYVESNITCTQSANAQPDCHVVTQRNSERHRAPSAITPLSFPEIFDAISLGLPRSFGATQAGSKTNPSVSYLNSTSTTDIAQVDGAAVLTNLPANVFSARLGQLLNTYYSLSQTNTLMSEGSSSSFPDNISTLATLTASEEVYSVSWPWFVFLFIATMLMLLAAVAGVICDCVNLNPEFLGYTSSIIRDSKYVSLPSKDGPLLDGIELTRRNRDFPLKMGSVSEGGLVRWSILKRDDSIQMRNPRDYGG